MAKAQQRFAVDDEDAVTTDWIEAQKNLSMSIHVLIQDYVKRFGNTDAYAAVLSRGFGPADEHQCEHIQAAKTQPVAPAGQTPTKKERKAAPPAPKKDTSVPDPADSSTDAAPPAGFNFGR